VRDLTNKDISTSLIKYKWFVYCVIKRMWCDWLELLLEGRWWCSHVYFSSNINLITNEKIDWRVGGGV
jgi:hypothetical protein